MISRGFHLPSIALLAATCFFGAQAAQGQPKGEVHILWIGNSLTYYNEMPKMLAELAEAGGQRTLVHQQETPGGCTLEKHWNDGKALTKLQSRKWDYVVIQEHSQRPLKDSKPMFEYAKKFDAEIQKQGGRTLLYLPFPLAKAPENQEILTKLHQDLAAELKASVVPVGPAWAKLQATNKPPNLFNEDGVHPNRAGSYLAACVFYSSIYGKSPEGLPGKIGGLSDKEARQYQAVAWKVTQDMAKGVNLLTGALSRNWITTGNWTLDKENVVTLTPRKGEEGWKRFDDYLWLKKQYRDFSAEFEFKVEKGGNSGFYFHVGDKKDPSNKGIEVQISDSSNEKPGAKLSPNDSGGIFPGIAPTKNAAKPAGEWNRMKVICRAGEVTVILNGEVVNEVPLDSRTLKDRPATGYLGFQDHGLPLSLRNIHVSE
ncbi:MAG: DUF1080 domain-containing protein [Planctomycetes bacterium]|nr:DUF1080 domain-containing protein [Planctomycetota bacterium]